MQIVILNNLATHIHSACNMYTAIYIIYPCSQEYENLLELIYQHDENVENWTSISFLTSLCNDSTDTSGIKTILHIFLIAALKFPTESVVESQISVFEHHYGKRRSCILEEHIFAEYFIHLVDPPINKSDLLLTNALNKHFDGQKWHFYSNKINAVMNSSKVIEKLKKVKPKFPFTTE